MIETLELSHVKPVVNYLSSKTGSPLDVKIDNGLEFSVVGEGCKIKMRIHSVLMELEVIEFSGSLVGSESDVVSLLTDICIEHSLHAISVCLDSPIDLHLNNLGVFEPYVVGYNSRFYFIN